MEGAGLPEGVRLTELDGGVHVVTEAVPSVRSVALGLWVRTGSRDEVPEQAGVSHFLEHLLFKGTERYSAIEISERFDGMGAATNAATSKESTHLHARFLDEHTDEAFGLLAEMLLAPALPPLEIDSERQVVLEEIAMYEDEPQDRVHDVLSEAIYGNHPLGRRVIGDAGVIASISPEEISGYHSSRYVGPGIVVGAAGHLEHDRIVALAEELLRPEARPLAVAAASNGAATQRLRFHPKETEQYHICFGGPGIARGDERRFVMSVLDAIFGGSISSRLFVEVREKRGLAYAVGSYTEQYVDSGLVGLYVGTRSENVDDACGVIATELEKLRSSGVGPEELARAKEHVKGRLVLGLESTSARMGRMSRAILFDLPVLSLDELLARVDAVTVDDLAELANEVYHPGRLSAACVGADESRFRDAASQISDAFSAAGTTSASKQASSR
jgi:predicted Zn-dependent peptidase